MAADLPILIREPSSTPPQEATLHDEEVPAFDATALSPLSNHFSRYAAIRESTTGSPRGPLSPSSGLLSPYSPLMSGSESESFSGSDNMRAPFNFQSTQYTVGKPPGTASPAAKQTELGRRRGHRYARSSISHQIILSPMRPQLQLPTSLPIPTFEEIRASMTKEQRNRWIWCTCHLLVAGYVQFQAHSSLSMTALSHLLFFDALGAFLCVAVDMGRNFEVWTRGSLRNPFGLERSEVLAGLAMSIILLFMGLDLISHGLTHALESTGGHEPHHSHDHDHPSPGRVTTAVLAAMISTLVSAATLGNHTRMGRALRPSCLPSWIPSILRNPSHALTLSCSTLLLLLPLLNPTLYPYFDNTLGFTMALAMAILGCRLSYTLGRMLLMSYSGPGVKEIIADLEGDEGVAALEGVKVWQVHYGLCMASFKVRVRAKEQVDRVRERIMSLVRSRLGGGVGVKWEVSSMISVDRD
ncbi:hypothetical protein EJ08DRAFT_108544 [Tothia fuscella]|uniref:Cation efflux protein transmembrane domain-containing protein n=1 Tax=Tothia fuscella TaxID=1048955 RepID=A0A9P4NVV7_9PEZI|nr:hypothetical protein EJ08DRAFT_108544 [Tothia fuscella]